MATTPSPRTPVRLVLGAVVGLTVVLTLMLLAFAAPAVSSGAHDVPVGVSGPQQAVTGFVSALDQQQPGALDTTTYDSPEDLDQAIADRDVVGGLVLGDGSLEVVTATGGGAVYATVLKGIGAAAAAQGTTVTYTETAPFTADDPAGSGVSSLALPLVFGGMLSAAALSQLARRRPLLRVAGSLTFSVLAGLATTAVLQFWLGAVDGSYWLTAAGVAGGVAAVSLFVLGLESLLGFPGLGVGAVLMLFIANPLSGFATGQYWLPQPWGEIGQWLPIGAAGTVIRSGAFFDGHGAAHGWVVLTAWALLGLALAGLAAARRRTTSDPTGSTTTRDDEALAPA